MQVFVDHLALQRFNFVPLFILMLCTAAHPLHAQAPQPRRHLHTRRAGLGAPGSPAHVQVPPPADFHRPSRNFDAPRSFLGGDSAPRQLQLTARFEF